MANEGYIVIVMLMRNVHYCPICIDNIVTKQKVLVFSMITLTPRNSRK